MSHEDARRVAASALYGEEFGFTWEDVRVLHAVIREHLSGSEWEGPVRDLARRLADLLPPGNGAEP